MSNKNVSAYYNVATHQIYFLSFEFIHENHNQNDQENNGENYEREHYKYCAQ